MKKLKVKIMNNTKLTIGPLKTQEEDHFGSAFIKISLEDFKLAGFDYGDSIDVLFSNGLSFKDVPYYSGYYVDYGEIVAVGYQDYPYILLKYNYIGDFYKSHNLNEDVTAMISMNTKAKNISIQKLFEQNHSNNREDYISDESFCNFRPVIKNSPKEITIYRSASPCDNDYNRAHHTSELCRKYDVQYIFDLAENKQQLQNFYNDNSINNEYWKQLYKEGRVLDTRMSVNFRDSSCIKIVIDIFEFILSHEGPYLIHCAEGKDRTGFISIIIGALANQSIDDIENDYMKTYDEYYHINKVDKPDSYNAIKKLYFDRMVEFICNNKSVDSVHECAKQYLIDNGMNIDDLNKIVSKLNEREI